jgi:hypothetical protein
MMKPSIGRIVLVKLMDMDMGMPRIINGTNEHPAIVTAVHPDTMINARVLQDSDAMPIWATSISRELEGRDNNGTTWRWPPRVECPDPLR